MNRSNFVYNEMAMTEVCARRFIPGTTSTAAVVDWLNSDTSKEYLGSGNWKSSSNRFSSNLDGRISDVCSICIDVVILLDCDNSIPKE